MTDVEVSRPTNMPEENRVNHLKMIGGYAGCVVTAVVTGAASYAVHENSSGYGDVLHNGSMVVLGTLSYASVVGGSILFAKHVDQSMSAAGQWMRTRRQPNED